MKSAMSVLLVAILVAPTLLGFAETGATQAPARSPLADLPWVAPPPSDNKLPSDFPGALGFAFGSAGFANRTLFENADRSTVLLLAEGFENHGCAGLPAGWTEVVKSGKNGGWHLDCYDPGALAAGRDTAVVSSGRASMSIRESAGGYASRLDSRLVSPVIDLRHVSGASVDSNAPTDKVLCEDAQAVDAAAPGANRTASKICGLAFTKGSLHAYLTDMRSSLVSTFGAGSPIVRAFKGIPAAIPDEVDDLPLTPEALGFGMVNLTFRHWWDWKAKDGGLVEIRYERADGTWSDWRNLEGDLVFETQVHWADALQASGCAPWMSVQEGLFSADTFTRNTVVPVLCGGYTNYWVPTWGNFANRDVPGADLDAYDPGFSASALYSRLVENRAVTAPNGRVGDPKDNAYDPEGYTGKSSDIAFSKYTLNRFIGKRVQVAFHAVGHWEIPPPNRGWFIDDVAVSALVPTRDVGVREILAPVSGDLVNGANEAVTPKAVIKNFGRAKAERINVSFEIVAADGTVVYGPHYTSSLLTLDSQQEAVVSPKQFWRTAPGSYELRVRTWIETGVQPGGPVGAPETDVNRKNDLAVATFQAKDQRDLRLRVDLDPKALQTDVGGQKAGKIVLENRGNVPISGTLHLTYSRTDTSTTPPTLVGTQVEIASPQEIVGLPYGRNLTSLGAEINWQAIAWQWAQRVSATNVTPLASGVYAIVARFVPSSTDATLGEIRAHAYVYIRSTPPAALRETFAINTAAPYPLTTLTGAVESVGWTSASGARWIPGGSVYNIKVAGGWETPRPTAVEGKGMWIGVADDCRRNDNGECVPAATNLVDWYVLRKNLGVIADGPDGLRVGFATEGHFNFFAPDAANRTRGFLRVLPREMDAALDAAAQAGASQGATRPLPANVLTLSEAAHPCGRLERQRVAAGGQFFDTIVLVLERPHTWRSCAVDVNLADFPTRNLAVEWVLETNRSRLGTYQKEGDSSAVWCDTKGTTANVGTQTCPVIAPGTVGRWYLDAVSVRPLVGGSPQNPIFQDNAESRTGSQAAFGCAYLLNNNQDLNCRGWIVDASDRGTPFSSNWFVERIPDTDGTSSVLRYGYVTPTSPPSAENAYGFDDGTADATPLVLGAVRSPSFRLAGFATPALTFLVNYSLYSPTVAWRTDTLEQRAPDGASAWIVYWKDGVEVRELLTPDGGYDARVFAKKHPDKSPTIFLPSDGGNQISDSNFRLRDHPYAGLYDAATGPNVWNGLSNPGPDGTPQWRRAVFDLSRFARPEFAGLDFAIELHVVAQSNTGIRSGFFRVDDLRIEERTSANDVGVKAILSPIPGRLIGRTTQVIAAEITNTGLYDQVGVAVRYTIRDDKGVVVAMQNRSLGTDPLPGLLSSNPQRNRTIVFDLTWTPTATTAYTLTVETLLAQSLQPYPDTNPTNDAITLPIVVNDLVSLRMRPSTVVPDEALLTPIIGGAGEIRSFFVPIENIGTLPAVFEGSRLGDLRVVVRVLRENGEVVLERSQPIQKIEPGKSISIEFRDAWKPDKSGLYTIEYELVAPLDGDATTADNLRRYKIIVFNEIVPISGKRWSDMFKADAAWVQQPNRTGEDGWTFGGPYENGASGTLQLRDLTNLRSLRNLFLVLDHRYAFEEGFDAGLVEVSADGGVTWHGVPPRTGYPTTLSSASPLVEDPFSPVAAFSGQSGGWKALDLNLGAVEALRRNVPLLEADFGVKNPYETSGTGCERIGGRAPADCLTVKPVAGSGMWFSDKYAMLCTRAYKIRLHDVNGNEVNTLGPYRIVRYDSQPVTFPLNLQLVGPDHWNTPWNNTIIGAMGTEWCKATWDSVIYEIPWTHPQIPTARSLRVSLLTPQAITGGTDYVKGPLLETTKTLSVPFTVPADTTGLSLSFWDWRAIGNTVWTRQIGTSLTYVSVPNPNAVEVVICCDNDLRPIVLVPRQAPTSADNYRDWTLNTIPLADRLASLAGKGVTLEFRHHISTGYPETRMGGDKIGHPEPGDSDTLSPHIGWAIDAVKVQRTGDALPVLDFGAEGLPDGAYSGAYSTRCLQSSLRNQNPVRCAPSATNTETGPDGWRVRTSVLGNSVWNIQAGKLVAKPTGARTSVTEIVRPGEVVGDESRLILPLDLKSAVDDLRLSFDSTWKFTYFLNRERLGSVPYPVSGGRVEVSIDDGATWIPVAPKNPGVTARSLCESTGWATQTPFAGYEGDPQRNSRFGMCGDSLAFTLSGFPARTTRLEYDLSEFAGKDVLIGFHVFFTSAREAQGTQFPTLGPGSDLWTIDNLTVSAAILDTRDVLLRLRAGTDGSVKDEGWDVRGLRLLGVKHFENLGVRIAPPTVNGVVGSGHRPFAIEIVNKGQEPSAGTRLGIWINATDAAGAHVALVSKKFGPAPLADFGACANEPDVMRKHPTRANEFVMLPESSFRVCKLAGQILEVYVDPAYDYKFEAVLVDEAYFRESVTADNHDRVVVRRDQVLGPSELRVRKIAVSPNAVNPATDETVVTATIENFGVDAAQLGDLTLRFTAPDGTSRVKPREGTESTKFSTPLETRGYAWTLRPADFAGLPSGVYSLEVTAVTTQGPTRSLATTFYVGPGVFGDLGWNDHVSEYDLGNVRPDAWYESRETCSGEANPWFVQKDSSAGYTNNTPRYAFALPLQKPPPTSLGGDGGGGAVGGGTPSSPNVCPAFFNDLRTPRMSAPYGVVGPDGREHYFLTFWSRHAFSPGNWGAVGIQPVDENGAPTTSIAWVVNLTGESPDYSKGRFIPVTVDIFEVIRNYRAYQIETLNQQIRNADLSRFHVHFRGINVLERAWQIDDVSLTPTGMVVGPHQSYPAIDDTDKEFRYVVRNSGSYSERFRLEVTDRFGGKGAIPAGWHVVLLDEAGTVLWHQGSTFTPPPPTCNPVKAPSGPLPTMRLDPGESRVVRAKVCIPISESQAGRSNSVELGVTMTSVSNVFQKSTALLGLSYTYRERPNLAVAPGGIRVDNADLPVDQPRVVSVTVLNAGPVDAANVLVRLTDTMAASFGYEPIVLAGVDGRPVDPIPVIPSREARVVSFLWTPRAVGEHNLTVTLDPLDTVRELRETDNVVALPLRIGKADYPDLEVVLRTETLEPARGDPIWVELQVTNKGGKAATGVQLTFKAGVTDLLIHEGAYADDYVSRINPGETFTLRREWKPAFPGNILIVGGALPRSGVLERVETQKDNYGLLGVLVRSKALDLGVKDRNLTAAPGASVATDLFVTNFGETADDYGLRVDAPAGVSVVLRESGRQVTGVALGPGKNATVRLELTLPARIAAGVYEIRVLGASQASGAAAATVVRVIVTPQYGLAPEAAPFASAPGTLVVPILVRNEGNAFDNVTVNATGLLPGWSAVAGRVRVAPFGSAVANLTLVVPGSQAAALYEVFVVARNAGGTAGNATLLLDLKEHEALRPKVEGGLKGVRAGQTLPLTVVLENVGNVRGEAALSVKAPKDWVVSLGRSLVALETGETLSTALAVTLPRGAAPGKYDLRIDVLGTRSNRSTTAQVVVTESDLKVADLTFSPRVNVAPGTLVTFNATISNEGAPARDVTVAYYVDDFLLGVEKIPLLGSMNTTSFGFRWYAQAGEHVILVLVDPGDAIEETDEANNARLEVVRAAGEAGILSAARNAVPAGPAILAAMAVAAAALVAARGRKQ